MRANPFRVLGVPRSASADEIRAAYRRLARRYHPDVSRLPRAAERFAEVAEAYRSLSAPDQRGARSPRTPESGFGSDAEAEEVYDSCFRTDAQPVASSETTPRVTLELDLLEAHRGGRRFVSSRTPQGAIRLSVVIPPGVRDGESLEARLPGGDVASVVAVKIRPHELFESIPGTDDLLLDLPMTPQEAGLGGEMEVPGIDRRVIVPVPAGTGDGTRIRIPGEGLWNRSGERGRGDLVVRVCVVHSSGAVMGMAPGTGDSARHQGG